MADTPHTFFQEILKHQLAPLRDRPHGDSPIARVETELNRLQANAATGDCAHPVGECPKVADGGDCDLMPPVESLPERCDRLERENEWLRAALAKASVR